MSSRMENMAPAAANPGAAPGTATRAAPGTAPGAAARVDRKFIEEHQLVERYLENKLPLKGARELENWCRANPGFLQELRLEERTHAGLRLLESSGKPQDLREPPPPWWKTIYFLFGLGALTLVCVMGCAALFAKNVALRSQVEAEHAVATQGSLVAAQGQTVARMAPDHAAGIGAAKLRISRSPPEMIELHLDMSYSRESRFRVTVDKRDQGRVFVIDGQTKDSNGELKIALNSSGFAAGPYDLRIEAEPTIGAPVAAGWAVLDVQ